MDSMKATLLCCSQSEEDLKLSPTQLPVKGAWPVQLYARALEYSIVMGISALFSESGYSAQFTIKNRLFHLPNGSLSFF